MLDYFLALKGKKRMNDYTDTVDSNEIKHIADRLSEIMTNRVNGPPPPTPKTYTFNKYNATFGDAIEHLRKGGTSYRIKWEKYPENIIITVAFPQKGTKAYPSLTRLTDGMADHYTPTDGDIFAKDWCLND